MWQGRHFSGNWVTPLPFKCRTCWSMAWVPERKREDGSLQEPSGTPWWPLWCGREEEGRLTSEIGKKGGRVPHLCVFKHFLCIPVRWGLNCDLTQCPQMPAICYKTPSNHLHWIILITSPFFFLLRCRLRNMKNSAPVHTEIPCRCWQPCSTMMSWKAGDKAWEQRDPQYLSLWYSLEDNGDLLPDIFLEAWNLNYSHWGLRCQFWPDGLNPIPFVQKSNSCCGLDIFFMKVSIIGCLRDTHNGAYMVTIQQCIKLNYISKAIIYLRSLSQ